MSLAGRANKRKFVQPSKSTTPNWTSRGSKGVENGFRRGVEGRIVYNLFEYTRNDV